MASDALYSMLAQALSRPSDAYLTAQEGIGALRSAGEGYLKGQEIGDAIRKRKLQRQTLGEILGSNAPPELANIQADQAEMWVKPVEAAAAFTRATREPKTDSSLESILADNVRTGKMTMEEAAAVKRSFSPGMYLKPPPGYRDDGKGGLVPIPGGPAAHELNIEKINKLALMRDQSIKAGTVIKAIDESLGKVGPFTTGIAGNLLKRVPGTPSKDLNETLKTVKANVGFETLQNMRQNSPTGGALGQVSDRENELLQAVRGSLEQAQSVDQIVKNLKTLRNHYSNVVLINDSQTGDPEADDAIAKVISSNEPELKKKAMIQAIHSRMGR